MEVYGGLVIHMWRSSMVQKVCMGTTMPFVNFQQSRHDLTLACKGL
jgi:hypothetical protein